MMHHKQLMIEAQATRLPLHEQPVWFVHRTLIPIGSRPHCKHLQEMIPGFGAGLVIAHTLTHVLPPISTSRFAHLCRSRPAAQLKLVRCPRSLAPTLVALPSMSLIPSAPFPICGNRRQCARCNSEKVWRARRKPRHSRARTHSRNDLNPEALSIHHNPLR
jgi:hypothetical protein